MSPLIPLGALAAFVLLGSKASASMPARKPAAPAKASTPARKPAAPAKASTPARKPAAPAKASTPARKPAAPAKASTPVRKPGPIDDDIAAIIRDAVNDVDSTTAPSRPSTKTAPSRPSTTTAPSRPSTTTAPSRPSTTTAPAPAGYDPDGARKMAPSLAQHLTRAGRAGYDRRLLRTFQAKAGIAPDGIYGGASRGALLAMGAPNAPAPFFPPLDTVPYRGPTS